MIKLALLAIIAFSLSTAGIAYGEFGTVPLPEFPSDDYAGHNVEFVMHDKNHVSYIIQIDYTPQSSFDIHEIISIPYLDGTIETIHPRDIYIDEFFPKPSEEVTDDDSDKEYQERMNEKTAKEQKEFDESVGKLNECWYGENEYAAIQSKLGFETPDQLIQSVSDKSYYYQITTLNKAYEACHLMEWYAQFISQYANLPPADEGSIPWELDLITDFPGNERYSLQSPELKTQEDIAEEFKCSEEGQRLGLCRDYSFSDPNRGNPNVHLESKHNLCQYTPAEIDDDNELCPYKDMRQYQLDNPEYDSQTAYEQLQLKLCEAYMPQYQGGQKIPQFLDHCETADPSYSMIEAFVINTITGAINYPPTVTITAEQLD
jgi:hypothetical protein